MYSSISILKIEHLYLIAAIGALKAYKANLRFDAFGSGRTTSLAKLSSSSPIIRESSKIYQREGEKAI